MTDENDEEQLPLFDVPEQRTDVDPLSVSALKAELRRLRDRNLAAVDALRRGGVRPDPVTVLAIQLDTLADLLFDDEARLQYDVLRETRMGAFLDRCRADLRQAELLNSRGSNGGRIILPGQ